MLIQQLVDESAYISTESMLSARWVCNLIIFTEFYVDFFFFFFLLLLDILNRLILVLW